MAWTVRYVAPSQVYHRVRFRLRSLWWARTGKRVAWRSEDRAYRDVSRLPGLERPPAAGLDEVEAARALLDGVSRNRFVFLNKERDMGGMLDWSGGGEGKLWKFHLHYFEYLEAMALVFLCRPGGGEAERAYAEFRRLTGDWLGRHRAVGGEAWHPYTTSLRLVNWLEAMRVFAGELARDGEHRAALIAGIHGQARVLATSLELDLRGNHLLENLRALVVVSMVVPTEEAAGWGRRAWDILRRELDEQVRPDGGHFERCPGYHVLVLQHLLDIVRWGRDAGCGTPEWLRGHVRRMLGFLRWMRTPDGRIPLLKDSTYDACPPVDQVLWEGALLLGEASCLVPGMSAPGWRLQALYGEGVGVGASSADAASGVCWMPQSGYFRAGDGMGDFLVVDFGAACPDYLPGHAHADMFTFELWSGGVPWVVDSGVYEYTEGPWRDHFRSTSAHNTVEVNGTNQSDVYGAFRVGRRARVCGAESGESVGGWSIAQAYHDGYGHLGVWHRRVVIAGPGSCWVVVDGVSGPGAGTATSRLHLHPRVRLTGMGASGGNLDMGAARMHVAMDGYEACRIEDAWYSAEFGRKVRNQALCLGMPSGSGVGVVGMSGDGEIGARVVGRREGGTCVVEVRWREWNLRLDVPLDARKPVPTSGITVTRGQDS